MHRPISKAFSTSLALLTLTCLTSSAWAADDDVEQKSAGEGEASAAAEAKVDTDTAAGDGILGHERIKLGARLGLGFPAGYIYDDRSVGGGVVEEGVPLGDVAGTVLPLWLEGGYMFTPNIMAGIYFQYGIVFVADDSCPPSADCSGSDVRLGIQGQYHLRPDQKFDPWFGLGIGYEWFSYSMSNSAGEASDTVSGFEFLNLQGGVEIEIANHIRVGPFLSISLGNYASYSSERDFGGDSQGSGSGSIQEKAMHSWILIGAKGTYSL